MHDRVYLFSIDPRDTFSDCIRKHGVAAVAVCVATTLKERKERIDYWGYAWAQKVLAVLPQNITTMNLDRAYIDDGIHPTAICDYSESLIRLTTEEEIE